MGELVSELLGNEERCRSLSAKLLEMARPDATKDIVTEVKRLEK